MDQKYHWTTIATEIIARLAGIRGWKRISATAIHRKHSRESSERAEQFPSGDKLPWDAKSIQKHNKKLPSMTSKSQRQAADVANSVLERTGDEGRAIAAANSIVAKQGKYRAPK